MPYSYDWYNLQMQRPYPVDDASTCTGDNGERLPEDILADCRLRFPSTAGKYAFISGITVTRNVVTLVILAADDPSAAGGFTPLASLTLPQPLEPFRHYPLEALYPGTGGFVVFGDVGEDFQARFSTPAQSRLAPRVARWYDPLPVPTLRKLGRLTGLTGLVTIKAGTDVEVVKETVEIEGVDRDALVVRLLQLNTGRNVLADYIGPCGKRPESRTCGQDAVETVNGVQPDCDGNLNVVFEGVTVGSLPDCGGQAIDGDVGLDEVCEARETRRFVGRDLCDSESSESLSSESESSESPPSESSESLSSEVVECAELPYCESFDQLAATFFETVIGQFEFEADDSPQESCGDSESSNGDPLGVSLVAADASQRNLAVWDACAYADSRNKRIYTDIKFTGDTTQRNGGILVNYHWVDLLTNPHIEYFHVLLDQRAQKLVLRRFSGLAPTTIVAQANVGNAVQIGDWYRLRVTVQPHPTNSNLVIIAARATGITDPSWPAVTLSVSTSQFLPADGLYGLGTDRARTKFSYFSIEEVV